MPLDQTTNKYGGQEQHFFIRSPAWPRVWSVLSYRPTLMRFAWLACVGLALLRAVNAAEADTRRVGVVQDFDRVTVENGDNGAGEVGMGAWDKDYEENKAEKMERNCAQRE